MNASGLNSNAEINGEMQYFYFVIILPFMKKLKSKKFAMQIFQCVRGSLESVKIEFGLCDSGGRATLGDVRLWGTCGVIQKK